MLAFPDEVQRQKVAERLLARATNIESALQRTVTWGEAAQAFITAFSETLDLHLEPGELSPAEVARAEKLVQEKYAHPIWTERI